MSKYWKRKLADVRGQVGPGAPQKYGIEVELEHVFDGFVAQEVEGFHVTNDGSLRNGGVEFLTPPVTLEEAKERLETLWAAKEEHGWVGSSRCGVHIHMDMSDRTMRQLHAFALAYAFVEPVLFELCGPDREQNIFCVPWYRAPGDLKLLRKFIYVPSRTNLSAVFSKTAKYTAMNSAPLRKYGTMEFRGAPVFGRVRDMHRLLDAFAELLSTTLDVEDSEEIVDQCVDDPQAAMARFLPSYAGRWVLTEVADSVSAVTRLVRTKLDEPNWDFVGMNPNLDEVMAEYPQRRPVPRRRDAGGDQVIIGPGGRRYVFNAMPDGGLEQMQNDLNRVMRRR